MAFLRPQELATKVDNPRMHFLINFKRLWSMPETSLDFALKYPNWYSMPHHWFNHQFQHCYLNYLAFVTFRTTTKMLFDFVNFHCNGQNGDTVKIRQSGLLLVGDIVCHIRQNSSVEVWAVVRDLMYWLSAWLCHCPANTDTITNSALSIFKRLQGIYRNCTNLRYFIFTTYWDGPK